MEYLVAKWVHVLSSTLLFGTGLGSAYYMFFASRTRDPHVVAVVVRYVVLADWLFTTPTILIQPLSGLYLASLANLPLTTPWIAWSIVLYLVAGAAWLPVVWMQMRMQRMAEDARRAGAPLPAAYGRYMRAWVALGVVAFVSLVVVFFLMVTKPV